jgi:hypothetical protein
MLPCDITFKELHFMHRLRMLALTTRLGAVIASSSLVFLNAGTAAAQPQAWADSHALNAAGAHAWGAIAAGIAAAQNADEDTDVDEDQDEDQDVDEDAQGEDEDDQGEDEDDPGDDDQGEDEDDPGDDDQGEDEDDGDSDDSDD